MYLQIINNTNKAAFETAMAVSHHEAILYNLILTLIGIFALLAIIVFVLAISIRTWRKLIDHRVKAVERLTEQYLVNLYTSNDSSNNKNLKSEFDAQLYQIKLPIKLKEQIITYQYQQLSAALSDEIFI